MAEGHSLAAWGHTAAVLAMLANCHRDPKKTRAFRPSDFLPADRHGDPRSGRQSEEVIEIDENNIGLLRQAFTGAKES